MSDGPGVSPGGGGRNTVPLSAGEDGVTNGAGAFPQPTPNAKETVHIAVKTQFFIGRIIPFTGSKSQGEVGMTFAYFGGGVFFSLGASVYDKFNTTSFCT